MALTLTSTIVPAYSYNVWAGEKENNANISVIPQGLILEKENKMCIRDRIVAG